MRNCCASFSLPPFTGKDYYSYIVLVLFVYGTEAALQGTEIRAHLSLSKTDPTKSSPNYWVDLWGCQAKFWK